VETAFEMCIVPFIYRGRDSNSGLWVVSRKILTCPSQIIVRVDAIEVTATA
jgi:hypothetical protein